ncbi:uncharacterized protein LOC129756447 [Uranotaenia lowii]|uniref:uncharacterized protein LOC129756447 n=1 Tax=Uranotaenia lowii TaxID=190385 RepID=UPI00247AAC82|nr:uncharacterized protein LOC129756447 [Uranotaenia lowii]
MLHSSARSWTILSLLIVVTWCGSCWSLECYQCGGPRGCSGFESHAFVTCDAVNSAKTFQRLRPLFPEMSSDSLSSSEFRCVSVRVRPLGSYQDLFNVRGCIRDLEGLCAQKTADVSGERWCTSCDTDRCNNSAGGSRLLSFFGVGISLLTLVGGWLLM